MHTELLTMPAKCEEGFMNPKNLVVLDRIEDDPVKR